MGASMSEALVAKAIGREEERVVMAGSEEDTAKSSVYVRRLPVGAEVQPSGGVHFRVWAPRRRRVAVQLSGAAGKEGGPVILEAEANGYHSGLIPDARAGDRYWYLLDDETQKFPDPASRFQPE